MDLLSVVGIVLALLAITAGQYIDGGDLHVLINGPAMLIVFGGTLGAVLLQTPFDVFKRSFKLLAWVFFPPRYLYSDTIHKIVNWNREARKKGVMALESLAEVEVDGFSKKGLISLTQGCDVVTLRRIMEVELDNRENELIDAAKVFESMGGYSPTIGIIGAVLGLIQVMSHLTDPNELGAGIAVAFVATIYGVGLANLVFLPIANKLKTQINNLSNYREMILEGLVSIAQGEHPFVLEKKLNGFVGT